jgi:hypothetical protein
VSAGHGCHVKITTIGKGHIGGGLGRRWERAGHQVTLLGCDGGEVAEALTASPERAEAVLDAARPGAPWRDPLGIPQPSADLARAIDSMYRPLRAVVGPPTLPAVLDAARADGSAADELEGLAARVLQSALEQRAMRDAREAGERLYRS